MTSKTIKKSQPTRRGFTRSEDLWRKLGDCLIQKKYKKSLRDTAAQPTPSSPSPSQDSPSPAVPSSLHMRIFMHRPSKAMNFRFPNTEFFTEDPHSVRYMLLRVEGRRVLWALSTQVLQEKCPRWLATGVWKATSPRYDKLSRVKEPCFRALQTIVRLLHGGPPPAPDRFDWPFIEDLANLRDRLDLGAVVNPWMQNLLQHLCRDGGQYIMDLPDWPLLIPVCSRFESQQQFDLVCRRFIRNCQVDEKNMPHCQGITFSTVKSANWCRNNFLHRRQRLVDEVLAFLQERAANFASMPRGHTKQLCARVIARLLDECQSQKTSDGRFTTISLEQTVDVLRDNSGDADLLCAAIVRETLNQVATTTSKDIEHGIIKMLFAMK